MSQPTLDDFDDDLTVPAAARQRPAPAPFLDDFDDDVTVAASVRRDPAADESFIDTFDDDATLAFTPRSAKAPPQPPVPLSSAQPTIPLASVPSASQNPTPPSRIPVASSNRPWEPPRRPTAPPMPLARKGGTARWAITTVALLLLAVALTLFVILRTGDAEPDAALASRTQPFSAIAP